MKDGIFRVASIIICDFIERMNVFGDDKNEEKKDIDTFVPIGDSSSGDSQWKNVEEVSYPSLDEALELKFDLNNSTNIHQRLRNLNC